MTDSIWLASFSFVPFYKLFYSFLTSLKMSAVLLLGYSTFHMTTITNSCSYRAIRHLDGKEYRGRPLVVEESRARPPNSTKVFVGNLSATCSADDLHGLFSTFGRVLDCDKVKGALESRSPIVEKFKPAFRFCWIWFCKWLKWAVLLECINIGLILI